MPTKQAQIFEKYFKDSWQAINIKHGAYLPEKAPRNYPWEHTEYEPDNKPQDPLQINYCSKTLSNNKSPGPDGTVNELLRMLSAEIQETIHTFFINMWANDFKPKAWKTSNTIQSIK
jgi:hypothetical protein